MQVHEWKRETCYSRGETQKRTTCSGGGRKSEEKQEKKGRGLREKSLKDCWTSPSSWWKCTCGS